MTRARRTKTKVTLWFSSLHGRVGVFMKNIIICIYRHVHCQIKYDHTLNINFFSTTLIHGHLERAFCSTFLVIFLANRFFILVIFFLTFLFGNSAAVFVLFYWMMSWESGHVKKNLLA